MEVVCKIIRNQVHIILGHIDIHFFTFLVSIYTQLREIYVRWMCTVLLEGFTFFLNSCILKYSSLLALVKRMAIF
jgi:hypothetical protein